MRQKDFFLCLLFHNVVWKERIFNLCSVVSVLSGQVFERYRANVSGEFREARLKAATRLETEKITVLILRTLIFVLNVSLRIGL